MKGNTALWGSPGSIKTPGVAGRFAFLVPGRRVRTPPQKHPYRRGPRPPKRSPPRGHGPPTSLWGAHRAQRCGPTQATPAASRSQTTSGTRDTSEVAGGGGGGGTALGRRRRSPTPGTETAQGANFRHGLRRLLCWPRDHGLAGRMGHPEGDVAVDDKPRTGRRFRRTGGGGVG